VVQFVSRPARTHVTHSTNYIAEEIVCKADEPIIFPEYHDVARLLNSPGGNPRIPFGVIGTDAVALQGEPMRIGPGQCARQLAAALA
jgi:hypothetical protein